MSRVTKAVQAIALVSTLGFLGGTTLIACGFGLNALVRHVNSGCMPAMHETDRVETDKGCYVPLDTRTKLPLLADRYQMSVGLFVDKPRPLDKAFTWWTKAITTADPPYFGYYSIGDAVQWTGETTRLIFVVPFLVTLAILVWLHLKLRST